MNTGRFINMCLVIRFFLTFLIIKNHDEIDT